MIIVERFGPSDHTVMASTTVEDRGLPVVLVVGGNVPRGVATLCARQRGHCALFPRDVTEAARMLAYLPVAACVVVPPSLTSNSCGVASYLRRRAPTVPVALVLGPGRLDDSARILWPLTVPMAASAASAIADIAAQACVDWGAKTWEEAATTVDVTESLARHPKDG
jgi:hypothetical protein